ncbi:FGGY-family carbohydrate kinase [Metabacillus rhizolycopersici]|uniref:Xylulose kinase n=1 Tax=Metabacillus rhizolycopersici TaxID=2875709 RepID=A0ABS7UVK9_9BACI|nr:FGGY family carbohydrate kinase [Metabacillus rhizolycopersici]MBZ5752084.1 xylulose kinase [Metabacillus rhizolycopersici]
MTKELVIGIDAGTESVRVGIYDLQGKQVGLGITGYQTYHPRPGWAEQDPNEWWSALVNSVKQAMNQAGATKDQIIGLGLDTTCATIVLCKNDGTPLRRALLWMDIRSHQEADFISSTGEDALKYNGYGKVSPEWMVCKALWLKRNETETYENADKIMDFSDWYTYRLTGRCTGSVSTTTYRWHYNPEEGGLPKRFYEAIGLGDIFEKLPTDICNLGEHIGGLTREVAEELGLREGTPVAQGGVDALNGIIGLGVTKPGKLALITGSSHNVYGLTTKSIHRREILGSFPNAVIPNFRLVEAGQSSSGSTIKWFRTNFCKDLEQIANQGNGNVYDILNEEASQIPPGSEGLIVLDYWQGNRSPHVDPNARGLISGLTLKHGRAHLYRAIIEGIAYGTDYNIRNFRKNGIATNEIYAAGGATNSKLFLQIHSDVSNTAIHVPEDNQVACLGSAILASIAGAAYENIDEAVANMVRFKQEIIEPNQENHERYQLYAEQYRKAYPNFHQWMWDNTKIDQNQAVNSQKEFVI